MRGKTLLVVVLGFLPFCVEGVLAQATDSIQGYIYFNTAERLLRTRGNLKIGGYGGPHYNQPLSGSTRRQGILDVHRFIMLMGYQFDKRTQFITEMEFEHTNQVYVEQAFLEYRVNRGLSLRGGLVLIPMGIINLYHEPVVFNGVERPLLDAYLVPSTWREIGLGVSGLVLPLSIKYQAYVVNGFKSFDGQATIGGATGLRNGRQNASNAFAYTPNFTGRVEYFGLRGLNLAVSGYFGPTQSTLYEGLPRADEAARARADSSVVGVRMLGFDARYSYKGLKLMGQVYYTSLTNTKAYNAFTADKNGGNLGKAMFGYFVDLGYDLLRTADTDKQLIAFVRYSNFDTHFKVDELLSANPAYDRTVITTGLTMFLTRGANVKADVQWQTDESTDEWQTTFNTGFGIMF